MIRPLKNQFCATCRGKSNQDFSIHPRLYFHFYFRIHELELQNQIYQELLKTDSLLKREDQALTFESKGVDKNSINEIYLKLLEESK